MQFAQRSGRTLSRGPDFSSHSLSPINRSWGKAPPVRIADLFIVAHENYSRCIF